MTTPRGKPELVVGAITIDGAKLLMIRRSTEPGQGLWSVPGGRVERGETMAEAVTRELFEETGVTGVCGPLVGWVERIDEKFHFVIFDFEVAVMNGDELVAGDDASEAQWVPLNRVSEMNVVDGLVDFLAEHGIVPTAA